MKIKPFRPTALFFSTRHEFSPKVLTRCVLISIVAISTIIGTGCPSYLLYILNAIACGTDIQCRGLVEQVFHQEGLGKFVQTGSFAEREDLAPGTTPISAIAVDARTGNFFVAGSFPSADNVSVYNIAYYDVVTERWSALTGSGLKTNFGGRIHSMAISGNYLYVGGNFNQTYDGTVTNLNGIARYDIDAKTWSPLAGNGLKDTFGGEAKVYALAVSGNELIVGGSFVQTFDNSVTNLKSIARYDLNTNAWSSFAGNGLSDSGGPFGGGNVNSLITSGDDLIVGGSFSQTANGSTTNLNNIARYSTTLSTWSPLNGNGLTGEVETMAVSGNNLFVGGSFHQAFDGSVTNLWRIARYDLSTNTWSPLTGNGLSGTPHALLTIGDVLYIGGEFSQTQDGVTANLNNIARYNTLTNTWSTLAGNGLNDSVGSIANIGGNLYVGGAFLQTFDGTTQKNINRIARYDISANSWARLGSKNGKALDNTVNSLAAEANGNIYAGGSFSKAADGTDGLNGIARFDPATKTWTALAHNGLNGTVNAVAISGDNLYVGGIFTATFDGAVTDLNNIARYNLTSNTWSALAGNGLNSAVYAVAISGNKLFAGGAFSMSANGAATNLRRIAGYDLVSNIWSPLTENGLNSVVTGLAVSGDNLFAAGFFTQTFTGGTALNYIARYDVANNAWSALANNGLNSNVGAMTFLDDTLSLQGDFTRTADNSVTLNRLGQYNIVSDQWSAVATGTRGFTAARATNAAAVSGNELYIGGSFIDIGGTVSNYFTRIYLQQWKVPASDSDWHTGANWTTGAVPAANSNALVPYNAANIDITSADVTMNDLRINGGTLNIAAGKTLTINGTLELNGGTITGEGTLVIANCRSESIMNAGATAYIQTALVRCVDNSGTFTFPVGTANGYSPVTIKNIAGSGNVLVKPNQGSYPNPASGLPANRLARWWQIENPGGGVSNADLYFSYLDSDITGSEINYRAFRIAGGIASPTVGGVNVTSNRATALNVSSFSDWTLAEASAATATPTGTPVTVSISGTVTYANAIGAPNPRFVSNVIIGSSAGSPSVNTTTGAPGVGEGSYTLTGFGSNAYTITPVKTGGQNGISSFDAARIAQHVAGPPNPQLTGVQLIIADVSGNNTITSFDAGMVAKFVAGPPYAAPGIGSTATWRFQPANRNYASVASPISGEDYSALLMGEVTGNWTNTGARPSIQFTNVSPITVNLPELMVAKNRSIIIPITVKGIAGQGVISYEFDLRYDPSVMRPQVDPVELKGTLSRAMSYATNVTAPGIIRVVVYGVMPIEKDGVLLDLKFTAADNANLISPLTLENFTFNEGLQPTTANGQVRTHMQKPAR